MDTIIQDISLLLCIMWKSLTRASKLFMVNNTRISASSIFWNHIDCLFYKMIRGSTACLLCCLLTLLRVEQISLCKKLVENALTYSSCLLYLDGLGSIIIMYQYWRRKKKGKNDLLIPSNFKMNIEACCTSEQDPVMFSSSRTFNGGSWLWDDLLFVNLSKIHQLHSFHFLGFFSSPAACQINRAQKWGRKRTLQIFEDAAVDNEGCSNLNKSNVQTWLR